MTASATPDHPLTRQLFAWMQANTRHVTEQLSDPAVAHDPNPASDAAIRVYLGFVAEAVAAIAPPAFRDELSGFRDALPNILDERIDQVDDEMRAVGEITAHVITLQFGGDGPADEGLRATVDRRLRIEGWHRVFVRALGEHRGDDSLAPAVFAWMAARQEQLANTIYAMDRAAKQAQIDRHGPHAVDDMGLVNHIGQAVVVQAHTRFLAEALVATMPSWPHRDHTHEP